MKVDLLRLMPETLKSSPLWVNFITAVEQQLSLLQRRMSIKEYYFKFDELPYSPDDSVYTTYPETTSYEEDMREFIDNLTAFCVSFGYTPNLELITPGTPEWPIERQAEVLQREAESIWFKLTNKGSLNYYNYIFKLYDLVGWVYLLAWKNDATFLPIYKTEEIIAKLNAHPVSEVFTDLIAYRDINSLVASAPVFDTPSLPMFDADPEWRFDTFLNLAPTPHLAFDYVCTQLLYNLDSALPTKPYLCVARYLSYLRKAVEYGKKCTVVPHIEAQLNIIVGSSLYYNYYSPDYTIPALQLDAAITKAYAISFEEADPVYLDTGRSLDEAISWYLDQDVAEFETKPMIEAMERIVVGNSRKSLWDKNHSAIFIRNLLYSPFEHDTDTTVEDLSSNAYVGTKHGTLAPAVGVNGKAYKYNGTTDYIDYAPQVIKDDVDTSLYFWFSSDEFSYPTTTSTLLDWEDILRVDYLPSTHELQFTFNFVSAPSESVYTVPFTMANDGFHLVYVEWVKAAALPNKVRAFVDNVEVVSFDVAFALGGDATLTLGTNAAHTTFFRGILDEVRIIGSVLNEAARTYVFETRVGTLQALGNPYYTTDAFFEDEQYEDDNWRWVTKSIPAWSISSSVIGEGDGTTYEFETYLKFLPIHKYFLTVRYDIYEGADVTTITLKDDGKGALVQEPLYSGATRLPNRSSGTVDYATGQVNINAFNDLAVNKTAIAVGPTAEELHTVLDGHTIKPQSFVIEFTLDGSTQFTGMDMGGGVIMGTGILSGSIDYETRAVDIVFDGVVSAIVVDYTDRYFGIPNAGNELTCYYKSTNIEINELGVLDNTGAASIYAAFPPIQFYNELDFLRVNIFVKK